MKSAKVLVSNIALPTNQIGSWTTRMTFFIKQNPDAFNFILSPNKNFKTAFYCKKRAFFTWKKSLRNIQLISWVARDYIRHIKKIARNYDKLTIVVMDDPHLIEAIGLIKKDLKCDATLVFSFHGFHLNMNSKIIQSIDKILWLSQLAAAENKAKYQCLPECIVIGNAVNSKVFYPLENSEFIANRDKEGYSESDEILIWMANDRPKKGFHIFKAVVEVLLKTNPALKVIIIGSSQTINHPNVKSIGKIANKKVASYLQLSNYYMFTTLYEEGFGLSVIEAYKCGNAVIASNLGAIPEVLQGLDHAYLVDEPKDIDSWIDNFNLARTNSNFGRDRLLKNNTDSIWNYEDWERKFKDAVIK